MKTNREEKQDGAFAPSRRDFLKLAGFGGATLVGAGALSTATACSTTNDSKNATTADQASDNKGTMPVETYETDVLIVGAGNSATAAAFSALKEGVRVTMVDKGPLLASGASNMTWGGFSDAHSMAPETPLSEHRFDWLGEPIGSYLINAPLWRKALDLYKEGGRDEDLADRSATCINRGHYLTYRNDDGSIKQFGSNMTMAMYMRHELDTLVSKNLCAFYDWTMITDFIIDEGTCCGAVGLHIPTGTLRVFRAKATIMATAAATTMFGFNGVRHFSVGAYDNTSDTDAACYRRGVGIAEHEYAQFDAKATQPFGSACGMGTLTCDAQSAGLLIDSQGNAVFDDIQKANDRNYFCQVLGKKRLEGGVFIDLSKWDGEANPGLFSEKTIAFAEKFGVDCFAEPIEAAPDMYEKGGAPVVDENAMTEAAGLFCSRGAGTNGENGGSCLYNNHLFGNYAGYTAAIWAKSMDSVPEFDWSVVNEESERLASIRYNEAPESDALRPIAVRHAIMEASYDALGPWRPVEKIKSAIEELERIEQEDLPRQVVSDPSSAMNKDWQEAIENHNLLTIALVSVKATLERQESRGSYIRDDCPEKDDENWNCLLVCRQKNGEMTFEKQALPEKVD